MAQINTVREHSNDFKDTRSTYLLIEGITLLKFACNEENKISLARGFVSTTPITPLHSQIGYEGGLYPVGLDGASSFSDSAYRMEPVQVQTPISAAWSLPADQIDIPPSASKDPSQSYNRFYPNARISGDDPNSKVLRRVNLPWLDGSRSGRGSVPTIPGAFVDEIAASKDPTSHSGKGTDSNTLAPANRTFEIDPPRAGFSSSSTSRQQLPESQPLDNPPRSPGVTAGASSVDTAKRVVEDTPAPAGDPAPVIAMARELYQTDSSACSDSETSMKGGRKRALSTLRAPVQSSATTQNLQIEENMLENNHDLPPRADMGRDGPSAHHLDTAAQTENLFDRRKSMTVQPIRPNKVAITAADLEKSHQDRQHSISVQPIKSHLTSSGLKLEKPCSRAGKQSVSSARGMSQPVESVQDSITGLENLMQEAMQIARHATEHNRSDEVSAILDEARLALHRSTAVLDEQETATKRYIPGSISLESSESSCSTCSSPLHLAIPAARSMEMRPDNLSVTYPVGPTDGKVSRPSLVTTGPRTVWDEPSPHHRVARTDPISIDWAYPQSSRMSPAVNQGSTPQHDLRRHSNPDLCSTHQESQCVAPERTSKALRRSTGPNWKSPAENEIASSNPRNLPTRDEIMEYINVNKQPPNFPRFSSLNKRRAIFEGTNSPREVPQNSAPVTDSVPNRAGPFPTRIIGNEENWGRDKFDEKDYVKTSHILRGRHHVTLKDGEEFSIHHGHRRQPIARNWNASRKRFTAIVACFNTALIGILVGIYAGEVPAIQYTLADTRHLVILGNVFLYVGMAITTFLFWPLPLLHGRKPYTILALGLALSLQIPPAIIVQEQRTIIQDYSGYVVGMLLSRGLLGLALGFAQINSKSTLLDLYGASLQSEFPHGEFVIVDDVRRHGGGMGYWMGIWSFSFIGSLGIGFLIGTDTVSGRRITWGFYLSVILVALMLSLNVIAPETRRSPHRRTMQEVELPNESVSRRVARGEVRMHVSGDGPKWWWEEVSAGVYLSFRMLAQSGFSVMAFYLGWTYAQIVLIIVLLGNLLSAEYSWRPEYVGIGVLAIAVGALLAVPSSKANFFSRSRTEGPRTDSMTFQASLSWTSHMVRRTIFMTALPIAGLAYTLASKGREVAYMLPIVFAAMIGYISNLAISECNGLIMETFDTSDLQPGTNSRHRLQSLAIATKRRRTAYSSYPRVSAGVFVSQSIGFLFAAAATGVGGAVTRTVGAQKATAITAGILMGLTLLLTCALVRYRSIQVIPDELFGSFYTSSEADRKNSMASIDSAKSWRAVVIGNPSGKKRRMNWLEMGNLSRWTEIRRLNRLLSKTGTQALNPGWQ